MSDLADLSMTDSVDTKAGGGAVTVAATAGLVLA